MAVEVKFHYPDRELPLIHFVENGEVIEFRDERLFVACNRLGDQGDIFRIDPSAKPEKSLVPEATLYKRGGCLRPPNLNHSHIVPYFSQQGKIDFARVEYKLCDR